MANAGRLERVACGIVAVMLVALWSPAGAYGSLWEKQPGECAPAPVQPTSEVLVFLQPGADAAAFARSHGLVLKYALRSNANACVFDAASADAAEALVLNADTFGVVRSAYLNVKTPAQSMAFVPDDPYFHKNTPSSGWPGQWHLTNEHTTGLDAGVSGAWLNDITGAGVTIGIIDTGIETTHRDLSPNYVAADSWDFGQDDATPDPVYSDDNHGTSVAGVAAARGGNGIGITGAAPYAGLAGLRVDFQSPTVAQFVAATLYHSSGANTNIKVKNHSYGYGERYLVTEAEQTALETSTAAGTIHVWAAGNFREDSADYAADANKMDLQNSPAAITVAALGSDGKFAEYSNFGANIFVTAPSSASGGLRITTTDRIGSDGYNPDWDTTRYGTPFPDDNYTAHFGGTSSAAPLVAGVIALGKQVQPNLDTRFAKHLLVKSCRKIDEDDDTEESDGGWRANAAGNEFNQNYGFGLIDAAAFTSLATQYSGVTPLTTETTGTVAVNRIIPDGDENGIIETFNISSDAPLEEVMVTLDIEHEWCGDLEAFLTSPENGTTSRLMLQNGSDFEDAIEWTYLTNAFWGENPSGTWSLRVLDYWEEDEGMWNSFDVTVRMGELVPIPEPATVTLMLGGVVMLLGRLRRRRFRK